MASRQENFFATKAIYGKKDKKSTIIDFPGIEIAEKFIKTFEEGYHYRRGLFVWIGYDLNDVPTFGQISLIGLKSDLEVIFFYKVFKTEILDKLHNCYKVNETKEYGSISLKKLKIKAFFDGVMSRDNNLYILSKEIL